MERYGETMARIMAGLYAGAEVRAERRSDGCWAFEMWCSQLWFEYSPHGLWTAIGRWRTLGTGLWTASRLRAGTHFWDADTHVVRLFNENVYAALREEP